MLSTVQLPSVIHTAVPDRGKLVTLVAGKQRHLLFVGMVNEVFITRSFNAEDNRTPFNCMQ